MEFRQKSVEDLGITPVDENSPIPLYQQVHMDLLNLMQSGALPSVRIDGARRVRGADLRAFVDALTAQAA